MKITPKSTRKASAKSTASNKANQEVSNDIELPRKRRIASLNAEFLVHYTSKSNSQPNPNEAVASSNISKRKRAESNNSKVSTSTKDTLIKKNKQEVTITRRGRPRKGKTKAYLNANNSSISEQNAEETLAEADADGDNHPISKEIQGKLDALQIENYEKILNDFAVKEGDELEEEIDQSPKTKASIKAINKQQAAKTKATSKKGRPKKQKIEQAEESEEEESITEKKTTKIEPSKPVESTATGRPKREASIRASAMIIQTNEIEKTKYQYHYSNSNPATPTPQPPSLASNIVSQPENFPAKLKTSQSFSNFQMPHHFPNIAAYNSFTKAVDAAAAQFVKPGFHKGDESAAKLKNNNKPLQFNSKKNSLRQISTTTTLGVATNAAACGDDDSSDILIIDSPKPPGIISNKAANANGKQDNVIYPVLTEELIKEHNKTHDSGSGNGTFSSATRDYIIKWASEYVMTDLMPFLDSEVPLEAYGTKILNQPQYLIVKARQEGISNQLTKTNSLKQSPIIYTYPKQTRETMLSPVPHLTPKNRPETDANAENVELLKNNNTDSLDITNKNEHLRNLISSSINEASVISTNNLKMNSNKPEAPMGTTKDSETKNSTDIIADINYFPKKCISAT